MDVLNLLDRSLEQTGQIVAGVQEGQLGDSTPCTDWTLRDLLNHTVGSLKMFTSAAAGAPDFSVYGNDNLGEDPQGAFDEAAAGLKDAWHEPGVVENLQKMPFGPVSGDIWGPVAVMEVVQHGWDIARASGQKPDFDDELSQAALEAAHRFPPDQMRNPASFGPEVKAPAGAPAHDQLAAFLGRQL